MRARQLSFLPKQKNEHGGDIRKGRRKTQRPFDPKRPLHVTLRSSRARGARSLLAHGNKWKVHEILQKTSRRHGIRIYRYANVGNHLHLLVQAKSRVNLRAFLREFSGVVAATLTGSVKGRPGKFWDGLVWTKIIEWGRQFRNTTRYILLNILESSGLRDRALLDRLEKEGILILAPDPRHHPSGKSCPLNP